MLVPSGDEAEDLAADVCLSKEGVSSESLEKYLAGVSWYVEMER